MAIRGFLKALKCPLWASLIVVFSITAGAQEPQFRQALTLDIVENGQAAKALKSVVRMDIVELKSLGLAVITNPRITAYPWAPTGLKSYEARFAMNPENQTYLCALLGYNHFLPEELISQPNLFGGHNQIEWQKLGHQFLLRRSESLRRAEHKVANIFRLVCSQ